MKRKLFGLVMALGVATAAGVMISTLVPRVGGANENAPNIVDGRDLNYDDSWVANVPHYMGGYRILYVTTPKSLACTSVPKFTLQTSQDSPEGFLADGSLMNLGELKLAIASLNGVPDDFNLSFTGPNSTYEDAMSAIAARNEAVATGGCPEPWGGVGMMPDD